MKTIQEAYWAWLVEKAGQPGRGRERQLRELDCIIFAPHVPGDENRAWYGKHLREVWYEEYKYLDYIDFNDADLTHLMTYDCTVLEMLLALSESIYEQTDGTAPYNPIGWFWVMVENLGIRKTTPLKTVRQRAIDFVGRSYQPNGVGSIFPLQEYTEDQRNVEIWYQMMTYLTQNGY